MIRPAVARLLRMGPAELSWRIRTQTRIGIDRINTSVRGRGWDRTELASRLSPSSELAPVRDAVSAGRWAEAHRALTLHFASSPQRFVIRAADRHSLSARIRHHFHESTQDSAVRADRLLRGEYDLLGYSGLRFSPHGSSPRGESSAADIDWHYDPIHERRAPRRFWSTIRYLDPACGDHKIIWELNRHQHWLALGRAFWLTSDTKYRDRFTAELTGWIDDNPPLIGINWASMLELSLRSLSWLWAIHLFSDEAHEDDSPWLVDLLLALDRQLTHVEQNLSYYFSPNTHLLGEALALYVAGQSLPELSASRRRAAVGRRVLVAEIGRQIAPDGMHCERSTHYHRYALDFYAFAYAIARITADPIAADFERAVRQLASAARSLADDNGCLPLIGDDDGGQLTPILGRSPYDIRDSLAVAAALIDRPDLAIGSPPEEAYWLVTHPVLSPRLDEVRMQSESHPGSTALADSGYYISRSSPGEHIVIDGGSHGYLNGGHAHADALSLTVGVGGVPMLIDPGTGSYTIDTRLRDRMRSTPLHNTVVVDGRPQSMPGGPFGWTKTANARLLRWRVNEAFDYFSGAHDGYWPVEHRRHVLVMHGDLVVVADLILGPGPHTAAVHWHVDPRWTASVTNSRVDLIADGRQCRMVAMPGPVETFVADPQTGLGWHSPLYGRLVPSTSLRIAAGGETPFWVVTVLGLDARNSVRTAEWRPVAEVHPRSIAHAVGIRIVRDLSVDDVVIAEAADAVRGATCRSGTIETDAHVLFWRAASRRQPPKVALVDGSFVRATGSEPQVALPARVSDFHMETVCAA